MIPDMIQRTADIQNSVIITISNIQSNFERQGKMSFTAKAVSAVDIPNIWLTVFALPHIFAAMTLPPEETTTSLMEDTANSLNKTINVIAVICQQ